ncbi:acetyl-CoA C-acyltransferase [Saccharospirillum salsuginis]|uniref:Acetyl-CoA acetyltransferase n=1 Tax=Saccharospirillum salsuginis TaxID=418750 RepID=A0A918K2G5_9GAMM|nr:acetyl-CoA C-acyltransferase [Saccharospirillum salsuginis]GGX45069.1 acetyl-CoA acetyltransferase [Saccharospirillum salsuginis]
MKSVYLTHYRRTAFSRAHPKKEGVDALAQWPADRLLAGLIDHCLESTDLAPDQIDDLSLGCALAVKEQWSFGGRYPLMQSRLGNQAASRMIDQQCGSGIAALRFGMMTLASGSAEIALAGGYEHMSRVPMGPDLFAQGVLGVPDIPAASGKDYDMAVALNMGLTAERLATESGIGREHMDAFACESHRRANQAQRSGYFAGEIMPVPSQEGRTFASDAHIRPDTNTERLAQLKPAFSETGQVTAGNSSPLTTGAALGLLMTEAAVERTGATPLARLVACADRGTRPELMGQGVVPAVQRLLRNQGLTPDDIDVWEINEAFSVVPLFAIRELGLDPQTVNINGGALALGHPLGATGIRLVGTLARTLSSRQGRYGIAAACIGGGQGIAMLLERTGESLSSEH